MVTNCVEQIMTQPVATTAEVTTRGVFLRLWKRIQFLLCSLHGHDPLLHYDQNRVFLRCASCGYETPGWELDKRRPRIRFRGDTERLYMATGRSFESEERRIA